MAGNHVEQRATLKSDAENESSASSTAVGISHPFSEEQRGHLFLHSPEKMVLCVTFGLEEDSYLSLCLGTSRFTVKREDFYGNQSIRQMTTPSTREQLLGDNSLCFKKKTLLLL